MRKRVKIFFTLAGLIFLLFVGLPQVLAANNYFSVRPAKQEIILHPGETAKRKITIENHLGHQAVFTISAENLTWMEKQGTIQDYELVSYLSLVANQLIIPDGSTADLSFTISVPANAAPGGRYGLIMVSSQSDAPGQAKVTTDLGSAVFLKIDGPVKESGRLVSFGVVGSPLVWGSSVAKLHLSFNNDGNIYLNPYGLVELNNIFGYRARVVMINPWSVLPGETRLQEIDTGSGLIGRYTATVYLNRGYNNVIDNRQVVFWVMPWWLMILLLFVMILIVVFSIARFKKSYAPQRF